MKSSFILSLMGCFCLFSMAGFAQPKPHFASKQNAQLAIVAALGKMSASQKQDSYDPLGMYKSLCNRSRSAADTAENVWYELQETEQVRGDRMLAILKDIPYLSSLSIDEANALLTAVPYVDNTCHTQLLQTVFNYLNNATYDENSTRYPIDTFYTTAAFALGHHPNYHSQIEDWVFKRVEAAARNDAQGAAWAGIIINSLAQAPDPKKYYPYFMNERERDVFEHRLEQAIAQFDRLKNEPADYYALWIPNENKFSNQFIFEGLLLQISSFFSHKDGEHPLKTLITTGGLKSMLREEPVDKKAHDPARFSDRGEKFYISHTPPGTDGNGNFLQTVNGRRHHVLSELILGLCDSYATHEMDGSRRTIKFIRSYLQTENGGFIHYLQIPFSAIRFATKSLDGYNIIHGWKPQADELFNEMTDTLRSHYQAASLMTDLQGGVEVYGEWEAVGALILKPICKGGKFVLGGAGKLILRALPPKAAARVLAVKAGSQHLINVGVKRTKDFFKANRMEIATAAAGSSLLKSDISNTKEFLKTHGWEAANTSTKFPQTYRPKSARPTR